MLFWPPVHSFFCCLHLLGTHLTSFNSSRFDQFSISPLSLKGIKDAGYEKMTVVQEATFPVILKGSCLCSVDGHELVCYFLVNSS